MFRSRIAPLILAALSAGEPFGEGEGYVLEITTSADLERLTRPESSLPGVDRAGKFLVPVRDGDPELLPVLFQNVNRYAFHQELLRGEFPEKFAGLTQAQYLAIVERRLTRQYFAGIIFRFEGSPAAYGFDIFTPDGIAGELPRVEEVRWVYQHLASRFAPGDPAYAPRLIPAVRQAEGWVDPGFPISFAFGGGLPGYIPYTRAVNHGRVQVLTRAAFESANERGAFSFQDILVLDHKPSDVEGVIAGAITESIQDDLGHLAIRTARRGTPNAFVRDATRVLAPWHGKLVRLEVGSTSYTIAESAPAEAEAWWASHRPRLGEVPEVDSEHVRLDAVWEIPLDGSAPLLTRYGGKAANFARLYALLEEKHRVPAFTVPFAHYNRYLETNRVRSRIDPGLTITYAQYIEEVLSDPVLGSDSALRFEALEKVRELIEDGLVDPNLVRSIALRVPLVFGRSDLNVRFRSSSNVEDLLEFNGAGLYSSLSGCAADDLDLDDRGPSRCDRSEANERGVARALKRVWASLWNFRAHEEREYYGIDHRRARMAVLVSEAFPNERSNGVAFTGNPDVRGDRSFLINVQLGDTPVAFPDPGVLPERDILEMEDGVVKRIIRSRPSTLAAPGQVVLTDDQLRELG
ncbi:MAG TPA: PEP/pyruvate-binding domain-containing protein, partial [Planctomycetota bacterium]|nr:PEP/pyruvate-binding domain-containing protein [Planctomycetota bacterium]